MMRSKLSLASDLLPAGLCLLSLLTLSAACGTTATGHVIDLDATLVVVGESEDEVVFGDAMDLFTQANDRYREDDHAGALRRYELLLEHFPESGYERSVTYNIGLCRANLEQWSGARTAFETVVARWPGRDDATDALFMLAEVESQIGNYEGVIPVVERVLRRARLSNRQRIEAHSRWGSAAVEMRDYAHAEQHYRQAIRLNQQAGRAQTDELDPAEWPYEEWNEWIASAYFGIGRIYHELFLEIKLILPEGEIRTALIDKGQLLEQARQSYLDAVRSDNIYWSPAAGFMIGQIYEDFYLDILACEVPHEFDELTLDAYFDQLRDYLDPLLRRALSVYEDNLAMSVRMGADSVWVEETEMGIERVQQYLFDELFQDEQELLIREQRHPHGAQDPGRAGRPPAGPDA